MTALRNFRNPTEHEFCVGMDWGFGQKLNTHRDTGCGTADCDGDGFGEFSGRGRPDSSGLGSGPARDMGHVTEDVQGNGRIDGTGNG